MNRKKKHSFELKLNCVKQMDEQCRSCRSVRHEYGIEASLISAWSRIYKHQGITGLLPRKGKRVFSSTFKLEVLTTVEKENLSLREARLRFDLSSDLIIINWQKRLEEFGLDGLEPHPKGRLVMEELPIKRKKRKSDKPPTRKKNS